ncbi:hypothetical protein [Nocardia sp. SC052]|uniref:hypothetical protein n=1 Tax=Nocardia sichangensis TaxID=3385975 RepID=UPI0039A07028
MADRHPLHARHRLARHLYDTARARQLDDIHTGHAGAFADAVIELGWRPPARVITDPAELDTLPIGSVVRGYGVAHQACPGYGRSNYPALWLKPTGRPQTSAELLADCRGAGVTVLYVPTEDGDTE